MISVFPYSDTILISFQYIQEKWKNGIDSWKIHGMIRGMHMIFWDLSIELQSITSIFSDYIFIVSVIPKEPVLVRHCFLHGYLTLIFSTWQVIIESVTQHVFGLAVYGDYLYWTDWILRAVIRANKYTGLYATIWCNITVQGQRQDV